MAKWDGPSGNLTWPLNPSKKTKAKTKEKNKTQQKQQNKQKTNQKQNKTNKEGLGPSEVAPKKTKTKKQI